MTFVKCARDNCAAEATNPALGIVFWPSLNRIGRIVRYLRPSKIGQVTRIIVGLPLCDLHFEEVKAMGAASFLGEKEFGKFHELIERNANIAIDRQTTIVQVSADDPDYKRLIAK